MQTAVFDLWKAFQKHAKTLKSAVQVPSHSKLTHHQNCYMKSEHMQWSYSQKNDFGILASLTFYLILKPLKCSGRGTFLYLFEANQTIK